MKCDFAVAYITVNRDQAPPVFMDTPYSITISELQSVGSSIFTVRATTSIPQGKIVYGVQGVAPAPAFFGLNDVSGVITVLVDLKQDLSLIYTVIIFKTYLFILYGFLKYFLIKRCYLYGISVLLH